MGGGIALENCKGPPELVGFSLAKDVYLEEARISNKDKERLVRASVFVYACV